MDGCVVKLPATGIAERSSSLETKWLASIAFLIAMLITGVSKSFGSTWNDGFL